jgi:hypothetical protein
MGCRRDMQVEERGCAGPHWAWQLGGWRVLGVPMLLLLCVAGLSFSFSVFYVCCFLGVHCCC